MTAKVLSTPRASLDLVELGLRIAQDGPRAAGKTLTAIDRKCKMLARLREELAPGLRSFAVGSYVVFYRAMRGGVEIIRVLRGARDIVSELESSMKDGVCLPGYHGVADQVRRLP